LPLHDDQACDTHTAAARCYLEHNRMPVTYFRDRLTTSEWGTGAGGPTAGINIRVGGQGH